MKKVIKIPIIIFTIANLLTLLLTGIFVIMIKIDYQYEPSEREWYSDSKIVIKDKSFMLSDSEHLASSIYIKLNDKKLQPYMVLDNIENIEVKSTHRNVIIYCNSFGVDVIFSIEKNNT